MNLLHEFQSVSGHEAGPVIVLLMQYGEDFSGPNKDVFYEGRAVGSAHVAHQSNFLHPTLYFYQQLPTGNRSIISFMVLMQNFWANNHLNWANCGKT